jgi:hypothetical protein
VQVKHNILLFMASKKSSTRFSIVAKMIDKLTLFVLPRARRVIFLT